MARRKDSKDRTAQRSSVAAATPKRFAGEGESRPAPLPKTATAWRYTLPCLLLIAGAAFVAFRPALDNELVYWDDDTNLMENAFIRDFSGPNIRKMWTEQVLGVWQPLTWMITALEFKLFDGKDLATFSRGLHAANLGLHVAAALLAFVVIRRLLAIAAADRAATFPLALNAGAASAALFFAVHPLRVEIVAWASGQPYILAFIPSLAAVWCYLKAHETGRTLWHAPALLSFAAALLCKSSAVPLVAVLLVLDVYPLHRLGGAGGWGGRRLRRVLLEKLPYAALAVAAALLTIKATAENKTYRPEPLAHKLVISGYCTMFYPAMTFVPNNVAPYYMKPIPFDAKDPVFVGATIAVFVLTAAMLLLRRRAPWLLAAWIAYGLFIAPNVGIIKHGGQLAADRYTYLSCLPWAALVGAAVMRLWSMGSAEKPSNGPKFTAAVVMAAWLVALGMRTAPYCRVWKNSVSLWSAMVERNPKYHMGFYNLAKAYKRPADAIWGRRGRGDTPATPDELARAQELFAQAAQSYRTAIELNPTYPEANVDLGNMMKDGKAPGGAEGAMERYETALQGRPGFHMAHMNLAGLLESAGRLAEAEQHLEAALIDAEKSGERKRLPGIRASLDRVRKNLNR